MLSPVDVILFILIIVAIVATARSSRKKKAMLQKSLDAPFPDEWRQILTKDVLFYEQLGVADKKLFEKRIRLFLATKNIKGIDTDIDDAIKLMVASSAVIPTFAFPGYNYPHVDTILVYPHSFDEEFHTNAYNTDREFISGMVGNRSLNGTVILSKPDLIAGFNGLPNKENVGIHEFVHLLDKEDGIIDGVPEILISRPFVAPWLAEIKKEMNKIEKGESDISPYALTNNAEFLAVVSEYFFDNPEKFKKRHPELYEYLATIFHQKLK